MSARLAVVVDTFPRWSERFVARELRELRRRGVELTVFALKKGALPPGEDPEWAGLPELLRVLPPVPSAPTLAAALKAMPTLRTKAARERLALVQREMGSRGVLSCARAHVLQKWLVQGRFTHVHAHFASLPSTIAWIAARDAKLPLSISVHARDLFVEAQLLDAKAQDARAIFSCHREAHERVLALPGIGRRAVLMPHGLPLAGFPFRAAPEPKAKGKPAEAVAAGRFVGKKGFQDLLAALEAPPLRKRPLRLTLFGDGPDRAALQRDIDRRGVASKVLLHPPEAGPRFYMELARADAFVAPYRQQADGDRDGVPNIVLEAFALGVPVVGTSAGGLGEILDPQTGYVAAAGDPPALAKALGACLDDPAEARRRAETARKAIEARYDIQKNIEPFMNMLG
ncbi:MAG: glycosyltransferase [Planctomycetota bacterium]|nr:glycosyltransferase [Planctomycetota bacterium]